MLVSDTMKIPNFRYRLGIRRKILRYNRIVMDNKNYLFLIVSNPCPKTPLTLA